VNQEIFKNIRDFPGYQVSTCGNIKSFICKTGPRKKPMMLKGILRGKYLSVGLRKNGTTYPKLIHSLVLENFIGDKPDSKYQCSHLDGNPYNNFIGNLTWMTVKENCFLKKKHGTFSEGEKCLISKLKNWQVIEIRKRYDNGEKAYLIAKDYPVQYNAVLNVARRKVWTHI